MRKRLRSIGGPSGEGKKGSGVEEMKEQEGAGDEMRTGLFGALLCREKRTWG